MKLLRRHRQGVAALMSEFSDKGCAEPKIVCKECDRYAWYNPGTNTIELCYGDNSLLTKGNFKICLRHEVMHAWDRCVCRKDEDNPFEKEEDETTENFCQDRACAEIRAISYSQKHDWGISDEKRKQRIIKDATDSLRKEPKCEKKAKDYVEAVYDQCVFKLKPSYPLDFPEYPRRPK